MNLQEYKLPELKKGRVISKRGMVIQAIIDMINLERPTKYKKGDKLVELKQIKSPIEKRAIAIKVSHLNDAELEWVYGTGREYKNKSDKNTFSKFFFGSLKTKNRQNV